MAINLSTASLHSKPSFLAHKHNNLIKLYHPSSLHTTTCAQTQGTDTGLTQEEDASATNGIYANNSYPLFIFFIIIIAFKYALEGEPRISTLVVHFIH